VAFVVFAGQSNALGFGMSPETLPLGYGAPDPLTFIWNNYAQVYEVMQPGVNTGTVANPRAWGPEVAFAREFRQDHPNDPLFIVKSVKGSTGLEQDPDRLDWSPRSEGELFDLTTDRVAAARAALGNPQVDGVFLAQGEQDAFVHSWAMNYQANLTEWLSAIREAWMHDPGGRIAYTRIADSTPFFETVRWAQVVADANDRLAESFDTYSYDRQADGLHYAADALTQIGANFEAYFEAWSEERPMKVEGFSRSPVPYGMEPASDYQGLFGGVWV
jgi:hypothetical protein